METLGLGEEQLNSSEISPEQLSAAAGAFTSDFRAAKSEAGFYSSREKIDWKVLPTGINEAKASAVQNCQNEKLRECLETAYGLLSTLTHQEWISHYRMKLKKKQSDEDKQELLGKLYDMSLKLAEWQHKCIKMIKTLEDIEGGEEFVASVWTQMSDIGARRGKDGGVSDHEVRKLKNGVIGLRNVMDRIEYACTGSGVKINLPTPDEDVAEKFDLFLTLDEKSCAVQVKSHSQEGIGKIKCQTISGFRSTNGLDDEGREIAKGQNKLWEKVKERRERGSDISALWVDVAGPASSKINQITGKSSQEYLEEQGSGEFAANVRQALGINRNTLGEIASFDQAA